MKNKKLIAMRNKKSLSQVEVAKQAEVSTRQYQRIESEGVIPNAKSAIKIAEVLGTTVEELFKNI